MKKIAILGFGGRGSIYSALCRMMKKDFEVTSVIDTNPQKLARAKKELKLPQDRLFSSLDDFLNAPKTADWVFVCTQDQQHIEHALKSLEAGYNLLLEKPVACTVEDCLRIESTAKRLGRSVAVCHVLRYTKYYSKIKEIIDSGVLGKIIAIDQVENVGYWHQAHSFVRGDWRNKEESSPMILAKCCHDLDIAVYLTGSRCKQISSVGELNFFKKENAPEGAAEYCLKGCKAKDSCPYDCEKIYVNSIKPLPQFIRKHISPHVRLTPDGLVTIPKLYDAMNNTDFGKCVFMSDNNVVDYQVTTAVFENGITSTLTMTAFSNWLYRETRIRGSHGDLICNMDKGTLELRVFGKKKKTFRLGALGSHGGGDNGLIKNLARDELRTDISASIESHLMAFAAEESRLNGGIPVNMKERFGR